MSKHLEAFAQAIYELMPNKDNSFRLFDSSYNEELIRGRSRDLADRIFKEGMINLKSPVLTREVLQKGFEILAAHE